MLKNPSIHRIYAQHLPLSVHQHMAYYMHRPRSQTAVLPKLRHLVPLLLYAMIVTHLGNLVAANSYHSGHEADKRSHGCKEQSVHSRCHCASFMGA